MEMRNKSLSLAWLGLEDASAEVDVVLSSLASGHIAGVSQRLKYTKDMTDHFSGLITSENQLQGWASDLQEQLSYHKSKVDVVLEMEPYLADEYQEAVFLRWKSAAGQNIALIAHKIEFGKLKEAENLMATLQEATSTLEKVAQPGYMGPAPDPEKKADYEAVWLIQLGNQFDSCLSDAKRLSNMSGQLSNHQQLKDFQDQRIAVAQLMNQARQHLDAAQPVKANLIIAQLELAVEDLNAIVFRKGMEPRLETFRYDVRLETEKHFCKTDARAKPDSRNPKFYCEKQPGNLSLKPALNAFFGCEAFSSRQFTDWDRVNIRREIAKTPGPQLIQMAPSVLDVTEQEAWEDYKADPIMFEERIAREKYRAKMGIYPEAREAVGLFQPDEATQLLNQLRPDLPPLTVLWLENPENNPALQDQQKDLLRNLLQEGGPDRLLFSRDSHYVALRKNTEGDWFEIDSRNPQVKRVDPLAYHAAHPSAYGANAILHFGQEVPLS